MLVWLTLPFYDFCGFRSVAVNSVYKLQFFHFFNLCPFFQELTYRSDTSTDFHAWWLKGRGLAHRCASFGNFSRCSPSRGSKTSQKQFWGVNRRFQAKLAKSKNVHIIKTTASVLTKFCTVIKNRKCPSWVVPTHALQIQDGGRPPSWILQISKF